ncbi:MAG: HEAT repeat domain-containing protein [Planctomycetota bacterium]|nr:HEAT repeat domain-containing protein [Planctomycetota bacterium]
MAQAFQVGAERPDPPRRPASRPWPRRRISLLILFSGILAVLGWSAFPVVRFALIKRRFEKAEGLQRREVLGQIIRLRSPLAIPLLLAEIRSSDSRDAYLDDLLDLMAEEDLELLLERLGSDSVEDRSVAAFVIAALIERPWAGESEAVRASLPRIYGGLIDGLSGGAAAIDYVDGIRRVMQRIPDSDLATPILERLQAGETGSRVNALRAAYYLRREPALANHPEILPGVRKALRSEESRVRLGAILVLEDQVQPEDRPLLIRASIDPEPRVREIACSSLGGLGGEGVAEALMARLEDEEERVRQASILALGRLKVERVIPALLEMMQAPAMMEVGQGEGIVQVPNPFPGEAAAAALAFFPTDPVVDALGRQAGAPGTHERIRLQAIRSLGTIARPRAIPYLRSQLGHDRWDVRLEAILALKGIGGREGAAALLKGLEAAVRSEAPRGEIEALGDALRTISGEKYGPYPGDDREEGEAGIRAWARWLRAKSSTTR